MGCRCWSAPSVLPCCAGCRGAADELRKWKQSRRSRENSSSSPATPSLSPKLLGRLRRALVVAAEALHVLQQVGLRSHEGGQLGAVGFNFNGWGNKQRHALDATVAGRVAGLAKATFLEAGLVLEGGGIEVDGEGTAIITESCVLNPNRNPGLSREKCEAELSRLLGLDKIIWLPGIAGKDVTDGHTDGHAHEHAVVLADPCTNRKAKP